MQHSATFFITTARAGTQWLAQTLQAVYGDVLVAEHEPILYGYRPKIHLRTSMDNLAESPAVAPHIDHVREVLRHKDYVEVGFPCYAAAPLLVWKFPGQLRFVHLIRNPIRVAASLVTHDWYQAMRPDSIHGDGDSLHGDVTPEPDDPGVVQHHYSDRWSAMTPYEKALFYWTEVHLYGLEIPLRYPNVPYIRLRSEDMFGDPNALRPLIEHLNLPYRSELSNRVAQRVDGWYKKTKLHIDAKAIARHPQTLALAERFGYDVWGVSESEISRRYEQSRPSLIRRIRARVRVRSRFKALFGSH